MAKIIAKVTCIVVLVPHMSCTLARVVSLTNILKENTGIHIELPAVSGKCSLNPQLSISTVNPLHFSQVAMLPFFPCDSFGG